MKISSTKNTNTVAFATELAGGDGGGATWPLPRDWGVEEFYGDPTVGPGPKVRTRGQNRS